MKILVTGGCGFIGKHLVNALVELKHDVVVMDDLSKGTKTGLNAKAKFIKGDVKDINNVRTAMEGCSIVFHLAAIADARASDDTVYDTNYFGSKNVFDAANAKKVKIIFASSAAVYGNGPVPNKESADCKPLGQYGKSKLKAEKYLSQKTENYFIARFFNVYGPGASSAVNKFCKQITNYQDVTLYGNGMQTRDYVYVEDVIDALILAMNNTGLYNVGTGQDTSTTSLVDLIHNYTRCKPTIKGAPSNKADITRSRADIEKIKKIGWSPRTDLDTGMKLVLDFIGYKKLV